MSGNTKDKIAVRNNAGKTTPAATAPMANAYANATVLEKIENLAVTFRNMKCNETSSQFLFLNIKGNDKSNQTPYVWLITELKKSHHFVTIKRGRERGEIRIVSRSSFVSKYSEVAGSIPAPVSYSGLSGTERCGEHRVNIPSCLLPLYTCD
ncbi:hypothetical protein F2Q68_00025298 [Brassica cretica]|uniref:Uncharacterized protein n=1 Tax=Brassica cretica TaxID=69181 RepID=A0A8S9IDN3_BRACR|nr:hypothetical protein F2Q68_00025298 [Brassica cretica]